MMRDVVKKRLKMFIKGVLFKKMPDAAQENLSIENKALILELKKNVQDLEFEDRPDMPDSERMWVQNMKQLKQLIQHQDPRGFLKWNVVKRTMFVDTPFYILKEYRALKSKANFKSYWLPILKESTIGSPSRYYNLGESSGNLVHHAYHMSIFQDVTDKQVSDLDFILEFGGGYGSMCRVIHQMKFNKKYIIFDLPIFSVLQSYYLKSLGLPVLSIDEFLQKESGILCISSIKDLEGILEKSNIHDLSAAFIATWSLSETSLPMRNEFIKLIGGFKYFLIAYQHSFGEVDNMTFFNEFCNSQKTVKWQDWNIQHMKGSRYLVGY